MKTDNKQVVVDLLAPLRERTTVEQRVERRIEVLRMWLRDGVPLDAEVPSSLASARRWDDETLGIFAIASPNEFTQTHPILGERVREIAQLLTALRKRYGRPTGRALTAKPKDSGFDRRDHERQLEKLVTQWHAARDQALSEKARADASDARSRMLLDENAHRDKLIADLRRQLAERQGLRAV